MILHPAFYLLPDTVNFENLRTYEGAATAAKTGYFLTSGNYPDHPANGPHAMVKYDNQYGNRGNGEASDNFDRFQASTNLPPYTDGNIEWTCEWEYEVFRNGQVVGSKHHLDTITIKMELTEETDTIKAAISKGEANYEKTFNKSELE